MNRFQIIGALAFAVAFSGVTIVSPSTAEAKAVWSKLGTRKVTFKKDKDTIRVTAKDGLFNGIKIKVSGGAIEMNDIRVTFGNGKTFSPKVRAVFRKKTASRVIDLPGNARIIRKVDFKYRSLGKRGKRATVSLYGRHGKRAKVVARVVTPAPAHPKGQIGATGASPTPAHHQGTIGKKVVRAPGPKVVKVHGGIGKKVVMVNPGPKVVPVKGGIGKKVVVVNPGPKVVKVKGGTGTKVVAVNPGPKVVSGGIGKKVVVVSPGPKPVKVAGGIGKKVVMVNPGPKPVKVVGGIGKKVVVVGSPKPIGSRPGPKAGGPKPAVIAVAQAKGWIRLGSRQASFKGDRDVVNVGAAKGTFRAIDLRVKGSPLEMHSVRITFGNGATFEPNVRHAFKQGSWTRRIDLPGGKRTIQRVEFRYRSIGAKSGKADVVLYGQH
jgi:hypothetical protein